ncbi:uncharacterized protein LOC130738383 [Lotus japonicus]|uniref:uncharacterized protein LOC130738383 n=1 Tax=Lotus japonicus TaxID=34305 RepID=UPI0025906142|nr:uncharacterized protein LOC130738383 [Lotus japonicus]
MMTIENHLVLFAPIATVIAARRSRSTSSPCDCKLHRGSRRFRWDTMSGAFKPSRDMNAYELSVNQVKKCALQLVLLMEVMLSFGFFWPSCWEYERLFNNMKLLIGYAFKHYEQAKSTKKIVLSFNARLQTCLPTYYQGK